MTFDDDVNTDRTRTDPDAWMACEILLNVATKGTALSATETIEVAQNDAESLARMIPEYLHAAHEYAEIRYRDAATKMLGDDDALDLTEDTAWGAVIRRLCDAETDGWDPGTLLRVAQEQRELVTADSVAKTMSWRSDTIVRDTPHPPKPGTSIESPAPARAWLEQVAARALGATYAERARAENAWPAFIASLRRAENHGRDPQQILANSVEASERRTARSISETLAWRVNRRVADVTVPAATRKTAPEMARGVRQKDHLLGPDPGHQQHHIRIQPQGLASTYSPQRRPAAASMRVCACSTASAFDGLPCRPVGSWTDVVTFRPTRSLSST